MSGKVVVPLDGSELAERALPPSKDLARATEAQIVPVRAVDGGGLPPPQTLDNLAESQPYLDHITQEMVTCRLPPSMESVAIWTHPTQMWRDGYSAMWTP